MHTYEIGPHTLYAVYAVCATLCWVAATSMLGNLFRGRKWK